MQRLNPLGGMSRGTFIAGASTRNDGMTRVASMIDRLACSTHPRSRFLGVAAAGAAAPSAAFGFARAASTPARAASVPAIKTCTHSSFPSLKQVDAGVLNVGYAEVGLANGPVVILLHGWPYDIQCYADVAPLLASAGYRVIVPYLRGYGTTCFRSSETLRTGGQAAFADDTVALMDALDIKDAIIAGFDWGARAANIVGALWPERCRALVSVSGYLIINLATNTLPLAPKAELGWWYQYYFATERGRTGYRENRYEFNKLIWQLASPKWDFDSPTYDRTAASFDNPDHVEIVIHNYRWRLSLVQGDPRYEHLERRLLESPNIAVPSITIASDFDGTAASGTSYAQHFSGKYSHRILSGIGHNVPQEAPHAFAQAIVDVDGNAGRSSTR